MGTQATPPTHIWPTGQHEHGQGLVPLAHVMATQRFSELQRSLHRHAGVQPAAEQPNRVGSIGSRAQASPGPHTPVHDPPQPSEVPQATPGGQSGTQLHVPVTTLHRLPIAHWRPMPHEGPPAQAFGTGEPQATLLASISQWGTHAQRPAVHADRPTHGELHAPQWVWSACVLTQRSPQSVSGDGQVQTPAMQVLPAGHTLSQAPQRLLLVWRL